MILESADDGHLASVADGWPDTGDDSGDRWSCLALSMDGRIAWMAIRL